MGFHFVPENYFSPFLVHSLFIIENFFSEKFYDIVKFCLIISPYDKIGFFIQLIVFWGSNLVILIKRSVREFFEFLRFLIFLVKKYWAILSKSLRQS